MKKVTAIICVYNEEKTIGSVINSVLQCNIVNELIVVNDGSTDRTKKIIQNKREGLSFLDIHFRFNMGKGYAMGIGIENASNEIVVFIDADQTVLIDGYIEQMLLSLQNQESEMVLGYSTVNILNKEVNPMRILTGERALFKKDVLPIIDKIKESRFGVETILYLYYCANDKTIQFIHIVGLKHKDKYQKSSVVKATYDYVQEGWEIAFTAIKNHPMLLKIGVNMLKRISKPHSWSKQSSPKFSNSIFLKSKG